MLDQRRSGVIKRHADFERGIAWPVKMMHLVPAVTNADGPVGRALDDLAGPFIIQYKERVFIGQCRFMDKGAAQLGFTPGKELPYELLFHVQVLIQQLTQDLLVDIMPNSHHGELEEACHGRWQDIMGLAIQFNINQDRPPGQFIEHLLGTGEVHFPGQAGLFCSEGFYR